VSLSIEVSALELASVNRWFGELDKEQAKANRRALKKAGSKAVSLAVKEIAARAGVKQKTLRRRLKNFTPPRGHMGAADFTRIWLGLSASYIAKHNPGILKKWRPTFTARMPSGHVGEFKRRPNPKHRGGRSTHDDPSPSGKRNRDRHALPIDQAAKILERREMEPIIFRHARAVVLTVYPDEFRRLLELNARRAAKRR
jgi:hypothetical protein